MDKETLYTYGFTIVSIIIVFTLLVILTPTALNITKDADAEVSNILNSANDFSDKKYIDSEYGTLTLDFSFQDGTLVNDTSLENYPNKVKIKINEKYDINVPEVDGYTVNIKHVNGIMSGDTIIPIVYTPIEAGETSLPTP